MLASKSLEISDYEDLDLVPFEETRNWMTERNIPWRVPHTHRGWEYGSALAFLRQLQPVAESVLDVGGGEGLLGPTLARQGYKVLEIDPSTTRRKLDFVLRSEGYRYSWQHLALDDLTMEEGELPDVVMCLSVLEHIPYGEQTAFRKALANFTKRALVLTTDMGDILARPWNNDYDRGCRFDSSGIEALITEMAGYGLVPAGPVDLAYHGHRVFDYTFYRLFLVREP